MARDDPASLGAVANFSVGRRGVGSVRWLEPTDVRGLDLDATVQLSKGSIEVGGAVDLGFLCWVIWPARGLPTCTRSSLPSHAAESGSMPLHFGNHQPNHSAPADHAVQVYLDEGAKPEVGHGLNKPAEVRCLRWERCSR